MQARAIFEAAIFMSNHGIKVLPEIMVPLVGTPQVCFISVFSCQLFIHNFMNLALFYLLWNT